MADSVAGLPPGRDRPLVVEGIPATADPEPVRPIVSRAIGVPLDHQGLARAIAALLPLRLSDRARD